MWPTVVIFKLDGEFFAKKEMTSPPILGDLVVFQSGTSATVVRREWGFEGDVRPSLYIDLKSDKKRTKR